MKTEQFITAFHHEDLEPNIELENHCKEKNLEDVKEHNTSFFEENQEQLAKFREAEPKRAEILEFILEGFSTEEIRLIIGRSYGATREFMSQCRKKFKPFIEICNEIEE